MSPGRLPAPVRAQLSARLEALLEDDNATRNERDAALFARKQYKFELPLPKDVADILANYSGRQMQQNRWGK